MRGAWCGVFLGAISKLADIDFRLVLGTKIGATLGSGWLVGLYDLKKNRWMNGWMERNGKGKERNQIIRYPMR